MKRKIAAISAALAVAAGITFGTASFAAATDDPSYPVEECIPSQGSEAWDETIVDAEAWDETIVDEAAHWQRYSWTGGKSYEGDPAPAFPGEDWQPNVQGDPHGIGVAGAYWVAKGESGKVDWFYLEWVPEVSHVVHHEAVTHVVHHDAVPPVICEEEPEDIVVVPNPPVVKDKCGLVDDHYGLPEGPEGVSYSRDGKDVVATLETGYTWGEYSDGWIESEGNLVFAFDAELFTDEPCTEPPVRDDEYEWVLELPLCGEDTVHEFGTKFSFSYIWENEGWTEVVTETQVERDREVELIECPTEVVPVGQIVVDECGTANDKVTAPADTEEIDYTLTITNVLYAEANEGFVIAEPGENDKYTLFEGIATFEPPVLTNQPCPQPVNDDELAFTGGTVEPLWAGAGVFSLIAGGLLFGWYRREKTKNADQL